MQTRRWRVSALLAVALHALPVVVLAGHEAHALQATLAAAPPSR